MTNASYTSYSAHQSTVITVATQSQLDQAFKSLAAGDGGTIKLTAAGNPYKLVMRNQGEQDEGGAILIQSADATNPAVFENVNLNNVSHVTFDGLTFDHSGIALDRGISDFDIRVSNSDHVEFTNNMMVGTANGRMTHDANSIQGGNLALIRDTSDVVFAGNEISKYFHGIALHDVTNAVVDGNDISKIQGDGIRGGGVHNVEVTDNHLHDFFGAIQTVTHNDMIQFWGANAKSENRNILIDGNVLDAGNGAATQGIFIRNEKFGKGTVADGHFHDITITNNIVHNGFHHGIQISDTKGVTVENNTVLWDQDATSQMRATSATQSTKPWISGSNNLEANFENNIAANISLNGVKLHYTNLALDYANSNAENFVSNHIENYGSKLPADQKILKADSPHFEVYGAIPKPEPKNITVNANIENPTAGGNNDTSVETHEDAIIAEGYTSGTKGADKFIFRDGLRGDVVSRDGADTLILQGLSDGKLHRVRDLDAEDTLDISAMLNGPVDAASIDSFVKLSTVTWGSRTHTIVEIDADGGANGANFVQAFMIENRNDLTLDNMINSGALTFGQNAPTFVASAAPAPIETPVFKQPDPIKVKVEPVEFSKDDVETLQSGSTPLWMKDGAAEVQNRINAETNPGGYAPSPIVEQLLEDAGVDVIEFVHAIENCDIFAILEDMLENAAAAFTNDISLG